MPTLSRLALACLLLSSASVVAAATCEPSSLDFGDKAVGWVHQPMSKLKRDTDYTLTQDSGRSVLRAASLGSASLYVAAIKPPLAGFGTLSWRWKTEALVPGADNREKKREDAPLRVLVAYDGDITTLPEEEQKRFARAKRIADRELPYAVVMYIWSDHVAAETVIPSAHTSQVKMIAVKSGADGLGAWQTEQRDLAADYRRAYGAEPGPLLGVAVMTDTDNTDTKAVGEYADIKLDCSAARASRPGGRSYESVGARSS